MQVEVTTYYLQITDPADFKPKYINRTDLSVKQVQIPLPPFNRFLYMVVGADWYWTDRLAWDYDDWLIWLDRSELHTWVAYLAGTPAGYFELEAQADGNVEIAYFGLLSQFAGQGLGGHLLSLAVEKSWAMGARRVWLHTCTWDHPYALANYRARGFALYDQKTVLKEQKEDDRTAWFKNPPPSPGVPIPTSNVTLQTQPIKPKDKDWVKAFTVTAWGADNVVAHGATYYPADLPGFIVLHKNKKVGLITYHLEGDSCEVVTINSTKPNLGIGNALIEAVKEVAREANCKRLWLITTNDNLTALGFYQKRGFVITAIHPQAITHARELKSEIPLFGDNGIPIRDEIELELIL